MKSSEVEKAKEQIVEEAKGKVDAKAAKGGFKAAN
jgi:hypothetical protein